MNTPIPTVTGTLAGHAQPLVDARDLHSHMQVARDFTSWIKYRIEQYGFVEGEDFCSPNLVSGENQGLRRFMPGHNRRDYHLSLEMAKELALVENNAQGRRLRRALIALEQEVRERLPRLEAENTALQSALYAARPDYQQLIRYTGLGLTPTEIGKLLGATPGAIRKRQVKLASLGLLVRHVNPALSAAGHKGKNAQQLSLLAGGEA